MGPARFPLPQLVFPLSSKLGSSSYLCSTPVWSCVMPGSRSIVPETDDRDVYLVLDDFGGRLGRAWRETDEESTDRSPYGEPTNESSHALY
jgi:hypothetical protein